MTVRQSVGTLPHGQVPDTLDERRQREHELAEALIAARELQARLEMLVDRVIDVRIIESLRNSLAADMVMNGSPPCQRIHNENGVTFKRIFDDVTRKVGTDR